MIAVLMLLAVACHGATWHVAQDGSGDFTVIQDAVDAASPGDVIRIHAGRYLHITEQWDVWGNGTSFADCHVVITKDNLTLEGDGADVTIIGPESSPSDPDPNYTGISVTYNEANSLTVRNLAVENARYGMYVASNSCDIRSCRFEGNNPDAVRLFTSQGCVIDDCEFSENGFGVHSYSPSANLTISNSTLDSIAGTLAPGCRFVDSDNVLVRNCDFTGGGGGVDFQQGTYGVIDSVRISDFTAVGIVTSMGGYAEIYNCHITGGDEGISANGDGVYCEGTTLENQYELAIYVNSDGASEFHDCNIINDGYALSVYCTYNGTDGCRLDMTDNYWGTISEDQIAEWIHDSLDDPDRRCTVDFIPFRDSVGVERHSWSAVKEMFRKP